MKKQLLEGAISPSIKEVLVSVRKRNYNFEELVWTQKDGDAFYTLMKRK